MGASYTLSYKHAGSHIVSELTAVMELVLIAMLLRTRDFNVFVCFRMAWCHDMHQYHGIVHGLSLVRRQK